MRRSGHRQRIIRPQTLTSQPQSLPQGNRSAQPTLAAAVCNKRNLPRQKIRAAPARPAILLPGLANADYSSGGEFVLRGSDDPATGAYPFNVDVHAYHFDHAPDAIGPGQSMSFSLTRCRQGLGLPVPPPAFRTNIPLLASRCHG